MFVKRGGDGGKWLSSMLRLFLDDGLWFELGAALVIKLLLPHFPPPPPPPLPSTPYGAAAIPGCTLLNWAGMLAMTASPPCFTSPWTMASGPRRVLSQPFIFKLLLPPPPLFFHALWCSCHPELHPFISWWR